MKQRLGIAQALIHDPKLIILDEPTTGLDPQGMKEIRELVVSLSKDHQKTIFLSSHILYEVELIANRMVIIDKGKAVIEGYVEDLLNAAETRVNIEVDNPEKSVQIINESDFKGRIDDVSNSTIIMFMKKDEIAPKEKVIQLREEIYNYLNDNELKNCETMGDIVEAVLNFTLRNYETSVTGK